MLLTLFKGFTVSLSLICAIGAQNAFVLKQGLLKNNIFIVCTLCFLCDVLLVALGVFSIGAIISTHRAILITMTLLGAAFLSCYGFISFRSAIKGISAMKVQHHATHSRSLLRSVAATLGITLFNPHVYLDTVVIIGGFSATLTSLPEKIYFMIGALLASSIWFYALGYGAKKLAGYFSHAITWKILDCIIGIVMWGIALSLLIFAYQRVFY